MGEMEDSINRTQSGEEIRRFLRSPAENGYRDRPCDNCGRNRMHVCFDGRLRCEKCSLDEPATEEDLAYVFSTVANYALIISRATNTE